MKTILLLLVVGLLVAWLFYRQGLERPAARQNRRTVAFFSAAVFVAHPIQTQAVTYIVSRSMLLSAFMYLGGTILFIIASKPKPECAA